MTTFNGATAKSRSKSAQNNFKTPSQVNIEQATAICLKTNIFSPKLVNNLEKKYFFRKIGQADPVFTLDGGFQLFSAYFDLFLSVVLFKVFIVLGENLVRQV